MLFDPIQIRDLKFRNRIVVSPMCQYSSEDGFASDWHLVHLGSRAVGGAGLVFSEATAVTADGRISPGDLGIWKDEHIEMLSRITKFIESQGSVPGIQLAHAGRKASVSRPWEGDAPIEVSQGGWRPIWAPSAIPFKTGWPVPQELTLDQIQNIKDAFIKAAQRALKAGFKVVEVHAAHGYLLHEFLSPASNRRKDQYGGSFENRIRFLIETVIEVRKIWPAHLPVFVRISATDWLEQGGWDIDQSVQLSQRLKDLGVDLIDCSSGGIVSDAKIPAGVGFQVPFAERIRQEAKIMTGAVGFITSGAQAETIIRTGQADMVFLAREFLRNPYWPHVAAKDLHIKPQLPQQYGRS